MKKTHHIDVVATLALFGSILCWSTVPLFLKYFTPYIDAWTANGLRYPFAALVLIPWLIAERRKKRFSRQAWKLAALPAVINFFSQILWAWAPYFIDPGLIAFLVRLSALWAVIGSFILFADERSLAKSSSFWIGFVFAALGFTLLSLGDTQGLQGDRGIGILIVVLASVFLAAYQLSVRRNLSHLDSRTAYGMVAVLTSSGLFVAMLGLGNTADLAVLPLRIYGLVFLSGLIGMVGAHVLFYTAIKKLGVAIASSANLLSAFITALFSRFLFDERLNLVQWIAGIILVLGCFYLTRSQRRLRQS